MKTKLKISPDPKDARYDEGEKAIAEFLKKPPRLSRDQILEKIEKSKKH